MGVRYQHTQMAPFILIFVVPMLVAVVLASGDSWAAGLIVSAMGLVVLMSLYGLTTIVSDEHVEVRFGVGLIRRRIPLARIRSAAVVRTPWYYGWGIRLTHRGWLWNVWGLRGVEVTYVDRGHFRIGSDEPERLAAEIQRAIGTA